MNIGLSIVKKRTTLMQDVNNQINCVQKEGGYVGTFCIIFL